MNHYLQPTYYLSPPEETNFDRNTKGNIDFKTTDNISNNQNTIEYKADGIMRVLFYRGCSGSSATFRIASDILKAHGLKSLKGKQEQTKPDKNPFYKRAKQQMQSTSTKEEPRQDYIILKALRLLNDKALKKNEIFSFKAYYNEIEYLYRLNNIYYTGMFRNNKLDHMLCTIKDCFGKYSKYGYTIFTNGTKADLCFKRRNYPNVKLKVKLHADELVKGMQKQIMQEKKDVKMTKNSVPSGSMQYYEDLFAFVYTSNATTFDKSMDAWCLLMKPLVNVDKSILRKVLLPLKNSRKQSSPHSEVIENYQEIRNVLENADPPLDQYLRL